MKELENKISDKIDNVKQLAIELQHVLEGTMKPKKNHTIFEVNLQQQTILKAVFDEMPPILYTDAQKGNISSKKNITKKVYCIYIPALNIKNVKKILKRNYNIVLP